MLLLAAASTSMAHAADESVFKLGASSDLTFSDNVKLSSTNKQAGSTLRVEPTLSWHRNAAVLKADVDLGVAFYTSSASQSNSTQIRLNGDLQGNFLNRTLLLDLSSRVAEQSTSVFNQTTPNGQADTTNSLTQTRYLSAGATYQNRLFTDWGYHLNYKTAYSEDSKNVLSDTRSQTFDTSIGNRNAQKLFYTELSANGKYYEPKNLTSYKTGLSQIEVGWRPMIELSTFVSGGKEYNGYLTEDRTNTIYDVGFSWRPSNRTSFNASAGHRFYGRNYSVGLSYATPKTFWNLSSSKSATHIQNQLAQNGSVATIPFLNSITDPVLRSTFLNAIVQQSPSGQLFVPLTLPSAFAVLTDGYTLDKTVQLTTILTGVRNSVSVVVFRKDSSAITTFSSNVTIASIPISTNGSVANTIRQDGSSINWNHKLDQRSSFGAGYIWLHSRANSGLNNIISRTTTLNYQYQLNKKASTGVTLRHYQSSSITNADVTENAIIGTIRTEF